MDGRDGKVFGKIIIEFIGVVVAVRYWIGLNKRHEDKFSVDFNDESSSEQVSSKRQGIWFIGAIDG